MPLHVVQTFASLGQVINLSYFNGKELNEDCLGTNYLVKTYFLFTI